MALSAGKRVGPYEILGSLGAGGMGEVYRARDPRLQRDVALKVLPEDAAADPERRRRFETEARAVAALNHPHILAVHDVGTDGDVSYVVFELVEGETLRQRLARETLPPRKAVEHTIQLCRGLAAAHARDILHRDLKPENVILTRDGSLKILDFGLAKLVPGPEEAEGTEIPTDTRPGTLLGTVGYLSPEQAKGLPADERSDVFAVGVVLYEMLSGERPFRGDTHAESVAAVLKEDPPALVSPSGPVPQALDRIVRRCLEKDPEDRFQGARDVGFALDALSGTSGASELGVEAPRWPGSRRRSTALALTGLALGALVAGVLTNRLWLPSRDSGRAAPVLRSEIDLTLDLSIVDRNYHPIRTEMALSPDGTLLVWASSLDRSFARAALHLRRLDTGEVKRLPGTEGASQPTFSPDGRWIAFLAREGRRQPTQLRKIRVEGGLVVGLAELSRLPMGVWWGPDGRILLGSESEGVRWVPAEGGPLQELTTADKASEAGHRLPSVLPDGNTLLVTTMPVAFGVKARIEAFSLPSGERKVVVEDGAHARYLPTGHLVFARQGVLMAAPFDLEQLALAAPPVPVVDGVSQAFNLIGSSNNSGAAQFTISKSGLLLFGSGGIFEDPAIELLLVDEAGNAEPLPGFDKPLVYPDFHLSPDGRHLAFVERARSGLLWLFDVERQTYRVLSDRGQAATPRWSPDGTRLMTSWTAGGPFHLWVWPLQGGDRERLTEGEHHDLAPSSWSPDGRHLAFARLGPQSVDVFLYQFEDRQVVPFLATQAQESHPEFSPDGRWLAYTSDESGGPEVYVTSFPDREQTITVSRQGGQAPAWSRDGRRLFYHSPYAPRSMMAVAVRHDPALSLGQPETLFRLPGSFVALSPMRSYEPHPDGRRFLIGVGAEREPPAPITRLNLVHNWFAELERLAPTGR